LLGGRWKSDKQDQMIPLVRRRGYAILAPARSSPLSAPKARIQDEPGDFACGIPDESDPGVIFVVYGELVA
jgi:hypothetical protein